MTNTSLIALPNDYLNQEKHQNKQIFCKNIRNSALEHVGRFFVEQVVKQRPFDWKSWMPAGRPCEYYYDLLAKEETNFVRACVKKNKAGKIYVFLIFGAGFNFDLLNYKELRAVKCDVLNERCTVINVYDRIYSVPTWDYLENNWRKICHPNFCFKKRFLDPNPFWNPEKFVYVQ